MLTLALVGIDHHILLSINLAGLVLGMLGSLFLTYDLLGRPGGPMRLVLRVLIPTIVGLICLVPLGLFSIQGGSSVGDSVKNVLFFGLVFGSFNGLFVDDPSAPPKRRFFFSFKDAGLGLVITFLLYGLLFAAPFYGPVAYAMQETLGIAVGVSVVAGLWRGVSRFRAVPGKRPPIVSGAGCLIGVVGGLLIVFGVIIATALTSNGTQVVTGDVVGGGVLIGAVVGGFVGAVTRYAFWGANRLPERGMEVIGVLLLLVAFAAQTVQPILELLNVPLN